MAEYCVNQEIYQVPFVSKRPFELIPDAIDGADDLFIGGHHIEFFAQIFKWESTVRRHGATVRKVRTPMGQASLRGCVWDEALSGKIG
jgi:hypothetical protein